MGRKMKKAKIAQVRSGIGLSMMDPLHAHKAGEGTSTAAGATAVAAAPVEGFITSRTARVLLAGAGFLADAYDLFVINLVLRLLRDEFPQYAADGTIHSLEGSVASAALVGSILGQLIAGSLADVFGRKKLFVLTALLISVGSFGSACSVDTPSLTIYGQIALWRFFLGLGVGGEYPLAATVTCESSSARKRGSLMAAVFSMQGAGSLLSGVIVYILLFLGFSVGFTWRFALAFGSVPVLLAFPWRLMMHETESFQKLKAVRGQQSDHHADPHAHRYAVTHTAELELAATNSSTAQRGPAQALDKLNVVSSFSSMPPVLSPTTKEQLLDSPVSPHATPMAPQDERSDVFSPERRRSLSDDYGQHMYISSRNNSGVPDGSLLALLGRDGSAAQPDDPTECTPLCGSTAKDKDDKSKQLFDLSRYYASFQPFRANNEKTPPTAATAAAAAPPAPSRAQELLHAWKFYKYHMLGTALCWFLLDVVFYGNGLFNHEITAMVLNHAAEAQAAATDDPSAATLSLTTTALDDAFSSILISLVSIPGYILSVMYIESIGRKNIQMMGFLAMAALYFTCAVGYDYLLGGRAAEFNGQYWFLVVYSLTFLFSNFGPNTTTFVIPGEIYPAEVRATCHGLSAACGKLGAATGAYLFPLLLSASKSAVLQPLSPAHDAAPARRVSEFFSVSLSSSSVMVHRALEAVGDAGRGEDMRRVMFCCSLVALMGALCTYFFTPRYDGELLEMKEQVENDKNETLNEEEEDLEDGVDDDSGSIVFEGEDDEETLLLMRTSYIPLEHRFLRPSLSDLRLLLRENDDYYNSYHTARGYQSVYDSEQDKVFFERKKRKGGFEMLEIIETADNIAMDDWTNEGRNA